MGRSRPTSKELDLKLTDMERRALAGMDAILREIQSRHSLELDIYRSDYQAMLSEIEAAHGLEEGALLNGWGVNYATWEIVSLEKA